MKLPKLTKRTVIAMAILLAACALISVCFAADGEESGGFSFVGTWWSILPPLIAIGLALAIKEVYVSLFAGILVGGLLYSNFDPLGTIDTIFGADLGMIGVLSDTWNAGILIFLVMLGVVGALVAKSGGSAAFGKWAMAHIKKRKMAQFTTFVLGVVIFVDDYFNCLTVGSVMRPVTDSHKISRAKLAYLVDSTAAPVCIIAPISSWAAAVAGSLEDGGGFNRFELFIHSIPFNFYALMTLTFIICLTFMEFDFGPMAVHEKNAMEKGDLFTTGEFKGGTDVKWNPKGKVADMLVPIVILIVCCILGLVYTGGILDGASFLDAFADCDASLGLVLGTFVALLFMFIWYLVRGNMGVSEFAECLVVGFKDMTSAILILAFAWTLSSITLSLGLRDVVATFINNSAPGLGKLLPFICCLVAMPLAFATGTSWGTFGMLLPIVIAVFPFGAGQDNLAFVGIAACLSGAVFGDHCSPISDTTIMSSAGAQSDHINHVSTQIPYALTCGIAALVMFLIAGFVPVAYIMFPLCIVVTVVMCFVIRAITRRKQKAAAEKA